MRRAGCGTRTCRRGWRRWVSLRRSGCWRRRAGGVATGEGVPPQRQAGLDEYSAELLLRIPAAFLLLVELVLTAPDLRVIWQRCDLGNGRLHAIALAAGAAGVYCLSGRVRLGGLAGDAGG